MVLALLLLSLAGVVGLGAIAPPVPAPQPQPAVATAPLQASTNICLGSPAADSRSALFVTAAAIGPSADPAAADSAAIDPLVTTVVGAEVAVLEIEGRGEIGEARVAVLPDLAYTTKAAGPLAPGVVAEQRTVGTGTTSTGLATQRCLSPTSEAWFVAGSGDVGRRAGLVISNPFDGPAVVDVTVWSESGPVLDGSLSGIGIDAASTITVDLDGLGSGRGSLAARVSASRGQVAAGMLVREVRGADPGGMAWVEPALSPRLVQVTAPVPGDGTSSLRLLNPGDDVATVRIEAITGDGVLTIPRPLDVPPGSVLDVALDRYVGGLPTTVRVRSDEPVAATVRTDVVTGLPDFAYAPSVDRIAEHSATVLAGPQRATVLVADVAGDGAQLRWRLLDGSGTQTDQGTLVIEPSAVATLTLPRGSAPRTLVLEPETAGTVVASRFESTTIRVEAAAGTGTRQATRADLLPMGSLTTRVAVPAVAHDLRTGLS